MGIFRRRGRTPSFDPVAGNGLINRRALLGQGIALAGAAGISGTTGAAAEPLKDEAWSLAFGEATPALQTPSRFEKAVTRALSNPKGEFRNSHARTPHQLLNGTITPNALHFSINHCGTPDIDPAKHKLVIHGMVKQPLEFTLETLSRYPLVTRPHFVVQVDERSAAAVAAGQHEGQLEPGAGVGVDQQRRVLARLQRPDEQQERRLQAEAPLDHRGRVGLRGELRADAVRHHDDPGRVDVVGAAAARCG